MSSVSSSIDLIPVSRALITVSDKTGLREFASELHRLGVEIFSTGGTRAHLLEASIPAREIAEYTQFPEMMDGRLKTLHPKIFGGILARHDRASDRQALKDFEIQLFPLVVVNLYPFAETISRPGTTTAQAIEQIDIGGPSLIRAAAKNHLFTSVLTQACQYGDLLEELRTQGGTRRQLRERLAREAFAVTAEYDRRIADYLDQQFASEGEDYPPRWRKSWNLLGTLRYGENPHQTAALYQDPQVGQNTLATAEKLHGKELSYNNYLDLEAVRRLLTEFPNDGACVIVKHNNPCGAAISDQSLADAARKGLDGDPQSAFGSIVGLNREVDVSTAEVLCRPQQFIEAILAPSYHPDALQMLTTIPKWKGNVRILAVGFESVPRDHWVMRNIQGGILVQEADNRPIDETNWKVVTQVAPSETQKQDLRFAWKICRHVRSNAITIAKDGVLLGVGAGQMSRVDSVEIALRKGGNRIKGGSLASEAFFPFADSIELASQHGISGVIQPGGSRNDPEVIAACDRAGIAMIFTGIRHFSH
jgi:phosphoribosylaminoimidazolecarboxamide formyltransferase / IMP cyclohydrolase